MGLDAEKTETLVNPNPSSTLVGIMLSLYPFDPGQLLYH
jgi:hypothetical protein